MSAKIQTGFQLCIAYRCYDRVTIVLLYKVFDGARWSCIKVITADKVGWEIVLSLPGARVPICEGTIGTVGQV